MNEIMDLRLRQIYAAMGDTQTSDIHSVPVVAHNPPGFVGVEIDFRSGLSDAELRNYVDSCIEKIAQLKDHLKHWCDLHNKPFEGDNLINTNREVGIIHDLWNRNKHFKLNRPSRSGLDPSIGEVNRAMKFTVSGPSAQTSGMLLDPQTGTVQYFGTGGKDIVVDARILDGQGKPFGVFLNIAEKAIIEWERLLTDAGVVLPPRPPPKKGMRDRTNA